MGVRVIEGESMKLSISHDGWGGGGESIYVCVGEICAFEWDWHEGGGSE